MANVKHFIIDNVVIDVPTTDEETVERIVDDKIEPLINSKQDKLIAGYGININGNVISSTGGGGSASHIYHDNIDACEFGQSTSASGEHSITIGKDTEAKGEQSNAQGEFTTAEGDNSHAEGQYTTAFGTASHAEGEGGQVTLFTGYNSGIISSVISINKPSSTTISDSDSSINFFAGSDFTSDGDSDSDGTPGSIFQMEKGNKLQGWIGRPLYLADGSLLGIITDIGYRGQSLTLDRQVSLPNQTSIYIKTSATGENSHTEGYLTDASGVHSHAEGERTQATGTNAHAEGYRSKAFGQNSHAEGEGTQALTLGSHSEGKYTHAEGKWAHTEGYDTKASGTYAHGEGKSSSAQGKWSHAEGEDSESSGMGSHAEGAHCNAQGAYSHAEGYNTTTDENTYWEEEDQEVEVLAVNYDENQNIIGINISTNYCYLNKNKRYKFVPYGGGRYNNFYLYNWEYNGEIKPRTDVNNAHISNPHNIIVGNIYKIYKEQQTVGAHAEGKDTTAQQNASHAEGISTTAMEDASHAEGFNNTAVKFAAHAEGLNTEAAEVAAHSEGNDTKASGKYSHAEGDSTEAKQLAAHSEGINTMAECKASHTEGVNTKTYNDGAHAEGYKTVAFSMYSHAEGYNTVTDNSVYWEDEEYEVTITSIEEGENDEIYIGIDNDITLKQNRKYKFESIDKNDEFYLYSYYCDGGKLYPEDNGYISNSDEVVLEKTYRVYKLQLTIAAHAEGKDTVAAETASHAEGINTRADGDGAHSEGIDSKSLSRGGHAEGISTLVNEHSEGSHTEGRETKTNADYSHAEGDKTIVQSKSYHAKRNATVKLKSIDSETHEITMELVDGSFNTLWHSFDQRKNSIVILKSEIYSKLKIHNFIINSLDNPNLTIIPRYNYYRWGSNENKSYADVEQSQINDNPDEIYQIYRIEYEGFAGHAEGHNTLVEGTYGHAEGENTASKAYGSHTEGYDTETTGKYSHAEGYETKTTNKAEHAQGRCNKSNNVYPNTAVEYVDLDLPSGNLWATCNIGAENPEEFGGYYAWGEVKVKTTYDWNTYIWCDGTADTITKYCDNLDCWSGSTENPDNLSRLVLGDDVAAKTLGENWRIPTKKDFEELIRNTDHEWTDINEKYGYKFMSKKDPSKYIFLPAAGNANSQDITGNYWSSDVYTYKSSIGVFACQLAKQLYFTYSGVDIDTKVNNEYINYRYKGYSIRPVSSKLKTINSVGVGESDGDHRNAIEITTDGNIFIKGIGNYDGSNPQSAQSLLYLLQELIDKVNKLNNNQ